MRNYRVGEKSMRKTAFLFPLLVFSLSSCSFLEGLFSVDEPQQKEEEKKEESKTEDKDKEINKDDYTWSTYSNPVSVFSNSAVFKGQVADPSVVRANGNFYCVSTGGLMLKSEDGCSWEVLKSNVIPRPTWGDSYQSGLPALWAPDLVKIKDTWFYYYSLSTWGSACGVGYATADDIEGEWTDHGRLFDSGEVGGDYSLGVYNAIDPQVFIDDDESVYMVFGSFRGLYIIQLTEDGTGLYNGLAYQREHKTLIAGQSSAWDGAQYEGSYIFKKDGYYYYMGSTGSCCDGKNSTYNVRVARSENILGPYRDSDGMNIKLSSGTSTYGDIVVFSRGSNETTKGPGHNSIVVDDAGNYFIYAHAYLSDDNFATRHLVMEKLEWGDNGMPFVEGLEFSHNEELDGPMIAIKD